MKLTESVRVPNAKEVHLGKHVFPSFALDFVFLDRIQESVSLFGKSSPYSRKIALVHMFWRYQMEKTSKASANQRYELF